MMANRLALLCFAWALTVACPVLSATYYVSFSTGADTNNGTSTGTPFKHAPGMTSCSDTCASTTIQAGDFVYLKRGDTWTGQTLTIPASGTSGNPVTYGAYDSGDRPVIDRECTANNTFILNDRQYVTIENIKFYRSGTALDKHHLMLIQDTASGGAVGNIIFDNIVADHGFESANCGADGFMTMIFFIAASAENNTNGPITIQDSEFYDTGHNHMRWQTVDETGKWDDVTITRNYFYDGDHHGFDSWVDTSSFATHTNFEITYNEFENCRKAIYVYGLDDTLIAYNLIHGTNTVEDQNTEGVAVGDHNNAHEPQNIDMIANIIYDTKGTGSSSRCWSYFEVTNGKVINNVCYDNYRACYDGANTNLTEANNVYYSHDVAGNCNDDASDPKWSDPDNGNFELQSDSPLINAGSDQGTSLNYGIYPGSTWPASVTAADHDDYGAGWERGAYVYDPAYSPDKYILVTQ